MVKPPGLGSFGVFWKLSTLYTFVAPRRDRAVFLMHSLSLCLEDRDRMITVSVKGL